MARKHPESEPAAGPQAEPVIEQQPALVAERTPSAEPSADEKRAALQAEIRQTRIDFIKGRPELAAYLTEELDRRSASRVADRIEALRAQLDTIQ